MPYHPGDLRRAILTAAVEAITAAGSANMRLRDVARRAGVSHAAHVEVMFRPDTHHRDDPALSAARARAGEALARGARRKPGGYADVAAWSLMHGFATLWLTGALPASLGEDLTAAARGVARTLFAG